MSEPSLKTPDTVRKKHLLIITAKKRALVGVESFLKNREWDVTTTPDLKEAAALLFSGKIDYVLLTVEHPSPGALRFPQLISQNVKIPYILFAEGLSPNGLTQLRATRHAYTLTPPVSGPAIERMVLKIERDIENAAKAPEAEAAILARVRSGALESDIHLQQSKTLEQYIHLLEGDEASAMKQATEEGFASFGTNSAIDASSTAGGKMASEPAITNAVNGFGLKSEPRIRESKAASRSRRNPKDLMATFEMKALVQGVEKALAFHCVQFMENDDASKGSLREPELMTCFEVRSRQFSGFIIAAFTEAQEHAESFSLAIELFIKEHMMKHDLPISTKAFDGFKLDEVNFEEWSTREGSFLRKSLHHSGEVGVAFFPIEEAQTDFQRGPDREMLLFELTEIQTNEPLAFDVYLHFPVAGKYIRFAGKGRLLDPSRKNRLESRGVKTMVFKREYAAEAERCRVQNYLNETIRKRDAAA